MRCFALQRRIYFDYGFCFLAAILLLMLPLRWVAAYFLAAIFHEMGHYLAVRLLGGEISCLEFSLRGAKMHASALPAGKQLVCLLAGPGASLSMLMFARVYPQLALCGLVQGVYNLLPLGKLDGGRALSCIRFLWQARKNSLQSGKTNSTIGALYSKR